MMIWKNRQKRTFYGLQDYYVQISKNSDNRKWSNFLHFEMNLLRLEILQNDKRSPLFLSYVSNIIYLIPHESNKSNSHISLNNWNIANGVMNNESNRELLGFNIYRDDSFIDSVSPNVFTYIDL